MSIRMTLLMVIHDTICATLKIFNLVYPFVLTNRFGNPQIVYFFLEDDDGENMNVMMARAEYKMEDMLFIGGDENNQGFTAWKRID